MSTHLLAFGLNYPNSAYALRGCVNDATDCAAVSKKFAATRTVVLDSKADRAGGHKAIERFNNRADEKDIGIVTLSSHGTRDKINGVYHEAVVWADMELSYESELAELLAKFPGLLLLAGDLCHSGGLNRGRTKARTVPAAVCKGHKPEAKTKPLTYLYWAGCKPTEYSYDAEFNGRPNGAFTYSMLQAFKGLKSGATYADWFRAIRKVLPNEDYPQTPQQLGARGLRNRKVPV